MILKNPTVINTEDLYIIGDVHGEWWHLNKFINRKRPKTILSVGDFGFWPKWSGTTELGKKKLKSHKIVRSVWHQDDIKNTHPGTDILFCPGNHEDWASLATLKHNEICNKVYYMPRGSVIKLNNGKTVLFLGGATSTDAHFRTQGIDHFPELSIINQREYNNILDQLENKKIDIIISHTCPEEFYYHSKLHEIRTERYNDPMYQALSGIFHHFKPSQWFFGHFHSYVNGNYKGCEYYGLNMFGFEQSYNFIKYDKTHKGYN